MLQAFLFITVQLKDHGDHREGCFARCVHQGWKCTRESAQEANSEHPIEKAVVK